MPYTKQELIDAYCRSQNCQASDLPTHEARHETFLTRRRAEVQERLDAIPASGKALMKQIALAQLAKEEAEQAEIDNAGVNL